MIGQTLLHYEITEKLGAGGMGEVYRARDTKLERDVALKILPEGFTHDAERLARFEREAQVLASLNHPHIAAIHGLEEFESMRFLVLEFVDGEDLAQRLERGAIPLTEAVEIARQVAEALEEAHEQGVVHRDLKPANIKVDPQGKVKVLDFGLAKALEREAGDSSSNLSQSPTWMASGTVEGVILGTAAYMSPEQARGKRVDRRTDVWAFGCVLFEMLAGRQLFLGETISDTMAAVLRADPPYEKLPETMPRALRRLLKRCLDRDVRRRLQSMGEARITLETVFTETDAPAALEVQSAPATSRARMTWGLIGAALGAGVAVAGLLILSNGPGTATRQPIRLEIPIEHSDARVRFALDDDGTKLVYANNGRLFVRRFDQAKALEVPNSEGASVCEWSPDGQWIVYSTGPKLYKIRPDGTQRFLICEVPGSIHPQAGGMTWLQDNRIVYATGDAGLFEVSSQGGSPNVLLAPDSLELDFHLVSSLPDDGGLLFVPHAVNDMSALVLYSDGRRSGVVDHPDAFIVGATFGGGHVVYNRAGTNPGLWAVPFDAAARRATGEPFLLEPAGEGVSASRNGHLVYMQRASAEKRELVVLNDRGHVVRTVIESYTGLAARFSLSPEGERVAVTIDDEDADIWIYEITEGTRQRFVFGKEHQRSPAWSPDGQEIVYTAGVLATTQLFARSIAGTTTRTLPVVGAIGVDFSADGKILVMTQFDPSLDRDIGYIILDSGKQEVFLKTPFQEQSPALSPDNRYIAYESNVSGQDEIYIQAFPEGGGEWRVSQAGGTAPRWNRDGTQLYFRNGAKVMLVEVDLEPTLRLRSPRVLFEDESISYIVQSTSPGEFVATRTVIEDDRPPALVVWLNWTASLEAQRTQ